MSPTAPAATTVNGVPVEPIPHQPSLAPTTTQQEDITLASQRKINLIWEATQAFIAVSVVLSTMWVSVSQALSGTDDSRTPTILVGAFFAVIGFYFGRTNHAAVGGIGIKKAPEGTYQGR